MTAYWEGVGPQRWPVNPAALHLPVEPLARLREVWSSGDDAELQARAVTLIRDIFDGFDGELHALAGLPPYLRAFSDPTVPCCNRDAADCDCDPRHAAIADSLRGDYPGITAGRVAYTERKLHTARPITSNADLAIEAALKDYDKEHSHDSTD